MSTHPDLAAENEELRARLTEAQETIEAIRSGAVDALVTSGPAGEQVFTLQGAETPYRLLMESMNEGAATLGPDGTVLYCNRRFAEIAGLPAEKMVGSSLGQCVALDQQKALCEMVARASSGAHKAEFTFGCDPGPVLPVLLSLSPIAMEPDAIAVVATDLSERKQHEQKLRQLNQQLEETVRHRTAELQAIFDTAPIGLAIAQDPEGLSIRGNPAIEQALGLERGAEISRSAVQPPPYRCLHDGRELHAEQLPMQRAARGESITGHLMDIVRSDGRTVTVFCNAVPLRDEQGCPRGSVGAFLDVTEHNRQERALAEKARLLDLSYDAILVRDVDDRITYWSKGAEEIYGYSREEAWGRVSHTLLKTGFPEPLESIQAKLRHDHRWTGELVHTRRDGTRITVASRWALDLNAQGQPAPVLEINTDVTEGKRTEARVTADLAALTRMHALSGRLLGREGFEPLLQEVMDAAVAIAGAERGTLQLLEGDSLRIAAHQGHQPPFLEFFAAAENRASVCGEALQRGERIVVPDVEVSPLFAGTPSLPVLREAGVRAVQSTPMVSRAGQLGILTTQWGEPHHPDEHDLWRIDLLARQAADLIEQARSEAALRASEQRLKRAQQIANVGSWDWDIPTGAVTWSEQMYRQAGQPLDFTPTHDTFRQLLHPDDRAAFDAAVQGALAGTAPYDIECRIIRRDGAVRILHTRGEVLRGPDGQPQTMAGASLDITERKQAERRIFAANQRLQALMQALPVGVSFSDDATCQRITGNPAVLAQFEVTAADNLSASAPDETVPGRQLRFFRDGQPITDAELPLQRAVAENREIPGTEFEVLLPSGRRWYAQGSGAPIRDQQGQVVGGIAVTVDITALKQAEAALRESEAERKVAEAVQVERQRFQDVLNMLPAYVVLLSPDYHVPFANRFFEERFGKADSRHCYEYLFNRQEPCDNCESFKVLQTNAPHHWEWTGPDGRNYAISDFPFTDVDGLPLVMEVGLDVTERKKAEAELNRHRDHLQELVHERTAKLHETNEELMRFNKAMVGRELRMIELKQEINALCAALGRPPAYPLAAELQPKALASG